MQSRPPDGHPLRVQGYDLGERIGTGGFSVVYRARQTSMNREVAIKVLNLGFATVEEQRTFERECHALGRLSHHPNIVTVFSEALSADGRPCLVMELYRNTFRERVERDGPLSIEAALTVGVKVAGALQAAHDVGILHRDLKPHNIFQSAYGEPALGDFGISTIDEERSHSGASGLSVAYAAPEILEEGRATVAADVYSLAATLYQLVAGTAPFASAQLKTAVRRILTEEPPALDRADAPAGLDRSLRRAMAKDAARRPPTALAFAETLREVQARLGIEPTPIPTLADDDDRDGATGAPVTSTRERSEPVAHRRAEPTDEGVEPPVPDEAPTSATIARARPNRPTAPEDPSEQPPGPDRIRRWLAVGLAVAVVAAVAVGVIVVSGTDDDTPAVSTAVVPPDDPFIGVLAAPTDVSVEAVDGGFDVTYSTDDDVDSVEIVVRSGPETDDVITATGSPTFVATESPTLCVELRSLGEQGRISNPGGPYCST